MALPVPEPGLVISFAYLWQAEYQSGLEDGAKDRPCVIIIQVRQVDGKLLVSVAPVTHSAPGKPEDAVEIPNLTKQRLGLDTARSWVVVTEVNEFTWPGPDLRPSTQEPGRFDYGFLPPGLFRQIRNRFKANGTAGLLQTVPRAE